MAKNNEYVGVDEKYVPEENQRKTHVQEPIIGSENAQKIRDGITGGINKLTSDEGKEKVKSGAKKGWKIAKGIGIGYLAFICIVIILVIAVFVIILVNFFKIQDSQDRLGFNNTSNSMTEKYDESVDQMLNEVENIKNETTKNNLDLHSGVNWRTYISDDLEKIYTNNKTGEHLITVINGDVNTTDPQQIRALANSIENESMSKKYDITIEYNDDGYVTSYTFEEF